MAIEVVTQGINASPSNNPVMVSSSIVPQSVELYLHPFEFVASVQLNDNTPTSIERQSRPTMTGQMEEVFNFPNPRPSGAYEAWRIGFVQNTTRRKEIVRWSSGMEEVIESQEDRLLDTMAEYSQPFYSDPEVVSRTPLASPSRVGQQRLSTVITPVRNLFAYPNGRLSELQNPWHASLSPVPKSDRFRCTYNDEPSVFFPLSCNNRGELRQLRVSQAQQWFLVLSKNAGPFKILLVTGIFTVFARANVVPAQRLLSGPQIDSWYTDFVPWSEDAAEWPDSPDNLNRWKARRWAQLRRDLKWARRSQTPTLMVGPPNHMQQMEHVVDLKTDGITAEEFLNAAYREHPCLKEYRQKIKQWQAMGSGS